MNHGYSDMTLKKSISLLNENFQPFHYSNKEDHSNIRSFLIMFLHNCGIVYKEFLPPSFHLLFKTSVYTLCDGSSSGWVFVLFCILALLEKGSLPGSGGKLFKKN